MAASSYLVERANLDFDVYGYVVHMVFTNDLQRARDEYDGDELIGYHFDTQGAKAFHAWNRYQNSHVGYLFFRLDADYEVIAHEAWHAIDRMLSWLGVKNDDGEIIAYHLGHLVGQLVSFRDAARKETKWHPVKNAGTRHTRRLAKKSRRLKRRTSLTEFIVSSKR